MTRYANTTCRPRPQATVFPRMARRFVENRNAKPIMVSIPSTPTRRCMRGCLLASVCGDYFKTGTSAAKAVLIVLGRCRGERHDLQRFWRAVREILYLRGVSAKKQIPLRVPRPPNCGGKEKARDSVRDDFRAAGSRVVSCADDFADQGRGGRILVANFETFGQEAHGWNQTRVQVVVHGAQIFAGLHRVADFL